MARFVYRHKKRYKMYNPTTERYQWVYIKKSKYLRRRK